MGAALLPDHEENCWLTAKILLQIGRSGTSGIRRAFSQKDYGHGI